LILMSLSYTSWVKIYDQALIPLAILNFLRSDAWVLHKTIFTLITFGSAFELWLSTCRNPFRAFSFTQQLLYRNEPLSYSQAIVHLLKVSTFQHSASQSEHSFPSLSPHQSSYDSAKFFMSFCSLYSPRFLVYVWLLLSFRWQMNCFW